LGWLPLAWRLRAKFGPSARRFRAPCQTWRFSPSRDIRPRTRDIPSVLSRYAPSTWRIFKLPARRSWSNGATHTSGLSHSGRVVAQRLTGATIGTIPCTALEILPPRWRRIRTIRAGTGRWRSPPSIGPLTPAWRYRHGHARLPTFGQVGAPPGKFWVVNRSRPLTFARNFGTPTMPER
jgi:hypothetical protein